MVIFGGSGDLTRRKLVPALFNLSRNRNLPGGFTIVGVSRSPLTDQQYRDRLREWVDKSASADEEAWRQFSQGIFYLAGDFRKPEIYQRINLCLRECDRSRGTAGNRIHYLATAPGDYVGIIRSLGAAGMAARNGNSGWVRTIVEKPFGRDLASARELNREMRAVFEERQIYRIDHYLGKETVQNLLVLRFANGIFEPLWNRQFVDSVQITAAESLGVGTRGNYYEEAGALRDMVQNHILQLLTLSAMEPPPDFEADSVRDEKAKVLHSIRPFAPEEVGRFAVRGQYGSGYSRGRNAAGYREEQGVAADSRTETFVAVRFAIDNWRWAGVPFYIRTGKNLPKQATEIAVIFRPTPHFIFRQTPRQAAEANVLALRIQPDEGITLKFVAKLPGQTMNVRSVNMDFRYGSTFGVHIATAYERLLLDCMLGDATLFDRADTVEAAWTLMEPMLNAWSSPSAGLPATYASGSWGPAEADELLRREGREWRLL
jgi:glucose-6-phosphate 1-dehydrogenase